ncbi:MAG: CHAT domain-containing protein [Moraxellaceae bacterium]|nr:CHAT domain-containing protein [Moraxellaceae bacterium]
MFHLMPRLMRHPVARTLVRALARSGRLSLLLGLLIAAVPVHAQNALDQAIAASQNGQWAVARDAARQALAAQDDNALALQLQGNAELGLGDPAAARKTLQKAWQANNGSPDVARLLAYADLLSGNTTAARDGIERAAALMTDDNALAWHRHDCQRFGQQYGRVADFAALAQHGATQFERFNRGRDLAAVQQQYAAGLGELQQGRGAAGARQIDTAMTRLKALPGIPPEYVVTSYTLAAGHFMSAGDTATARAFAQKALSASATKPSASHSNTLSNNNLWLAHLHYLLADLANRYGQPEEALALLGRAPDIHNPDPPFASINTRLLALRIDIAAGLRARDSLTADANRLLALAPRAGTWADYYRAAAYNGLTVAALTGNTQADRDAARQHGEKALALATAGQMEQLLPAIWSNMAIIYFRSGEPARGLDMARRSVEQRKAQKDWLGAITSLNNLGAMLILQQQYAAAVAPLQEAVQFVETFRLQVPVEARIDFIGQQVSAYQFLAQAQARLNQPQALYDTLENSRGRVLAETMGLGRGLARADSAWVQQNLAADEAALLFAVTEPGAVAVSVVTREGIKAVYTEDLNFLATLQRRFARTYGIAMRKPDSSGAGPFNPFAARGMDDVGHVISLLREVMQDAKGTSGTLGAVRDDLLKTYYQLLFAKLEPLLAGKTRLVISADEYLSFVPFEALMDSNGRYLVERYAVRYTPSMTVWRAIAARQYPANRKPMLAFGGALYAPYTTPGVTPVRDEAAFRTVQRSVLDNLRTGRSQRQNYAALGVTGTSWSYLPGTLREVAALQSIVPGISAYYGEDFTENRLKAMSKSGELAQYKVLHLATHGMVLPTLPELSTIVMTLPLNETGGEDGYLTAGEILNLKLQADFVALSACETGLGKIYAGEGVGGLTRAFLQAGANGMSVSLWAISDAATMQFMAGLYTLVSKGGMSYEDAMVDMKRRFVRGEFGAENRHPNFWAPFAYYGI